MIYSAERRLVFAPQREIMRDVFDHQHRRFRRAKLRAVAAGKGRDIGEQLAQLIGKMPS